MVTNNLLHKWKINAIGLVVVLAGLASGYCPNGYVRHDLSCYKLFLIQTTWAQAAIFCDAFGSKLAEIDTQREQHFLEGYLKPLTGKLGADVWIGGSDLLVESSFTWSASRDPLVYKNWAPGEPSNSGDEDCMALFPSRGFKWNDAPCETSQTFLCEIALDSGRGELIIG